MDTTLPAPNNIKKYWNDGSYLEVSESIATHVWYGSHWTWDFFEGWENWNDHSAIKITSGVNTGDNESKWGAWPLLLPTSLCFMRVLVAPVAR